MNYDYSVSSGKKRDGLRKEIGEAMAQKRAEEPFKKKKKKKKKKRRRRRRRRRNPVSN
jgi:predicted ribosome quality control (RQC) complex YloA/Tae2 family protein